MRSCMTEVKDNYCRKTRKKTNNQEMTTYYATLAKNEITVDANSEDEAKTLAIKKFMELLEEDKARLSRNSFMIRIEEELDSYDW